jgi:hypothetical protein
VTLAVAFAAPAAGATAPASVAAHAAGAAAQASSCKVKVTITGKRICLGVGKSCKRKYENRYRAKGFTCRPDAKGHYKLKRSRLQF